MTGCRDLPPVRHRGVLPSLYARWEAEGAREVFFQTWGESRTDLLRNADAIMRTNAAEFYGVRLEG